MREDIAQVARALHDTKMTVAVAESCTAGGLAVALTALPGASQFFLGGVIAYDNAVKIAHLGVNDAQLERHGAVSAEVAETMAVACRHLLRADLAVSITGIAGPDGGTESKPVGLVFVGLSSVRETSSRRFQFAGTRDEIRSAAVHAALRFLHSEIETSVQI